MNKNRKPDKETLESTFKQIHYFNILPKHIKGIAKEFNVAPNNSLGPAHTVNGTTTVIMGKINIPAIKSFN